MPIDRSVRRYSAFFRGWATAFGAHEKDTDEERGLVWLYGEHQLGLLLTPAVKRFLYPLFFGQRREEAPVIQLGAGLLRIGDLDLAFGERDGRAFTMTMDMIQGDGDLHLSQTYHLVYPSGTRILTLGRKAPLPLVYREIAPLLLQLT